jgi:ankyrin repeat protein
VKENQESINVDELEKGCFEIVEFKDGSRYEGMWRDFKKEGRGKLTYTGGKRFEGFFKRGLAHGHGKVYGKNGELINEGCWFEGLQIYKGEPSHDMLSGNLESKTIEYGNGDKFTGSLVEFEKEGSGFY